MTKSTRSALILAPPLADLTVLQRVLKRYGYQILAPDIIAPGATWKDVLTDAVRRADLVIGVCEGQAPSPAVAFDLGVATAADADILVVASPDCTLPSVFSAFFLVRASVSSEEALSFFFENVGPHKPKRRRSSPGVQPNLTGRLAHYRKVGANASGRDLEELVATIFTEAGFDAHSSYQVGPREVDLAVWSDALAPYLDNPLLIEVKTELTEGTLARTLAQLTSLAQAAHVRWALLVYRDGPKEEVMVTHARQASQVLIISLPRLLEHLSHASLFDILRTLRNRKVHGVER